MGPPIFYQRTLLKKPSADPREFSGRYYVTANVAGMAVSKAYVKSILLRWSRTSKTCSPSFY